MRVVACAEVWGERAPWRRLLAFAVIGSMTLGLAPVFAFDGTTSNPSDKIPKNFTDPQQALRAGVDELKAGDADASVAALTYAAEGGEAIARWKLGEMYADGQGVQRDDVKAYHYFNQLVEDYDEDQPDRRNLSAISNAFVAVGVYCLNGIANSEVRPDPERAHELFQYAATIFGDPNAQYNLAHMYMVGAGGVAKDNVAAVRERPLQCGPPVVPFCSSSGYPNFVRFGLVLATKPLSEVKARDGATVCHELLFTALDEFFARVLPERL